MSRSGRPAILATIALASVAALAACSGTPSGSAAAPTALPSGTIAVEAKEYAFTPSTITVPAGTVTFSVRNAGTQEHEFEVFKPDGTVLDEVEGLVPGLTKSLAVTLEPGTYQYMCKLSGHDQLGMKGTLTVTGS